MLAAAFEFNFLKALIVFLALIVAPALLLGLGLSLAVTYGRLVLHAMEMAGRSPALGLAWLALLIGFAVWAGRPLLPVGFDNFRQLHYTLVFPIFVALRELLRERLGDMGRFRDLTDEMKQTTHFMFSKLCANGAPNAGTMKKLRMAMVNFKSEIEEILCEQKQHSL